MNLRTRMRVGDVTRFHIVRTARAQTLAEHLYKTWVLTGALYDAIGLPAAQKAQALNWALEHDLPEILIGDPPTPVKRSIERRAGDADFWRKLEREAVPGHQQPLIVGTPTEYVVKIADNLEGWHFLTVEAVGEHATDTRSLLMYRATTLARKADSLWEEYHWWEGMRAVVDTLSNGKIEHCE